MAYCLIVTAAIVQYFPTMFPIAEPGEATPRHALSASDATYDTPGMPAGLRHRIFVNDSSASDGTIHEPLHCPAPPVASASEDS